MGYPSHPGRVAKLEFLTLALGAEVGSKAHTVL